MNTETQKPQASERVKASVKIYAVMDKAVLPFKLKAVFKTAKDAWDFADTMNQCERYTRYGVEKEDYIA